ncbi:hypothetical protein Smp_193900 [Schistosoma mansoni]|uniref:hypothetical protein n=1 Tax=Schistosoma mansoni TaxID=6183 RepID=UPI00022DC95C|nr:hypothetical protein Smp_193900 [Schistosoma mansoni]|eukprot:XP_018647642.1 hypothetical protein Smp_193900 [Schistosoma mansoni]
MAQHKSMSSKGFIRIRSMGPRSILCISKFLAYHDDLIDDDCFTPDMAEFFWSKLNAETPRSSIEKSTLCLTNPRFSLIEL